MEINGIFIEKEAEELMNWILATLPKKWRDEFTDEVMVGDSYDRRTLNKVFMYYCDEILSEIPTETYDKIAERYIMIEL